MNLELQKTSTVIFSQHASTSKAIKTKRLNRLPAARHNSTRSRPILSGTRSEFPCDCKRRAEFIAIMVGVEGRPLAWLRLRCKWCSEGGRQRDRASEGDAFYSSAVFRSWRCRNLRLQARAPPSQARRTPRAAVSTRTTTYQARTVPCRRVSKVTVN